MKFIILIFMCMHTLYGNDISEDILQVAKEAQKKQDYKKALYYYNQAAKYNNTEALLTLGTFYYKGSHVKQGYSKARSYFLKASNQGSYQAQYYLGILYSNKKTIFYDLKKAFNIFQSLEDTHYAPALNRLGMFYTFGMANKKDYKKAVSLFEKSSKQGFETAHCNLAYMYASGKGVWQNLGRAHAFAKEGYKNKNEICMNVWKVFKLQNYPEDKGWKFKFYNKPNH